MTEEAKYYTYDVFISYSTKDDAFANKLQQALENYKPEKDLKVPQRNIKTFRDIKDFPGGDYHKHLSENLKNSSKLLVICSPASRKSLYVDPEIKEFIEIRGKEHIIPVLLSGIPNNEAREEQKDEMAFPEELCKAIKLPLAISYLNFNCGKDKITKGVFTDSWYRILADIYELSRDKMEQREKRRRIRNRRNTILALGAIILLLSVSLVFALFQRDQAVTAQKEAETAREAEKEQRKFAEEQKIEADKQRDDAFEARNELKAALDSETQAKDLAEKRRKEAEQATKNEKAAKNQAEERRKQAEEQKKIAEDQTEIATEQRRAAVASAEEAKRRLVALYEEQGRQALLNGNSQDSIMYLNQAYQERVSFNKIEDNPSTRFLLRWNSWNFTGQIVSLNGHKNRINSVEFSRDGKRILTTSSDKTAKLWNAETGNLLRTVGAGNPGLKTASLSPDGTRIFTTELTYEPGDGETRGDWTLKGYLLNADKGGLINEYYISKSEDADDLSEIKPRYSADGKTFELDQNEEGDDIDNQQETFLYNSDNGELIENPQNYQRAEKLPETPLITKNQCGIDDNEILGFNQNHSYFIKKTSSLSVSFSVEVWDSAKCQMLKRLAGHTGEVNIAVFNPDSRIIVTAGDDNRAIIWDWQNVDTPIIAASQADSSLAYFSKDDQIVTRDPKGIVRLWNTATNQTRELGNLASLKNSREAISSDGTHILIEGDKNATELWDVPNCKKIKTFDKNQKILGFNPNGKYLLTNISTADVIETAFLEVWNVETGERVRDSEIPDEFMDMSLSWNGKMDFASLKGRNYYMYFSAGIFPFEEVDEVNFSTFSRDGSKLITANSDNTAKIWNIKDKTAVSLIGHKNEIKTAIFNPDSTRALTSSSDGTVKLWDTLTGDVIFTAEGFVSSDINAFSPDGSFVITIGNEKAAKIWDTKTGQLLASVRIPGAAINFAVFSLNEDKFLTAGNDGVRVWSAQKEIRDAAQVAEWVKKVIPLEFKNGRIVAAK